MKLLISTALAATLILSGTAEAKDRTEGWANWTAHAQRILAAMETGESPRLDSACNGVTRTVVGQGFQFPGWAMSLIQVCTVTQAAYHGSNNSKRSKQICKDLKSVSAQIGKAAPVPESAGAHKVAKDIAQIMLVVRDTVCVNFM